MNQKDNKPKPKQTNNRNYLDQINLFVQKARDTHKTCSKCMKPYYLCKC